MLALCFLEQMIHDVCVTRVRRPNEWRVPTSIGTVQNVFVRAGQSKEGIQITSSGCLCCGIGWLGRALFEERNIGSQFTFYFEATP